MSKSLDQAVDVAAISQAFIKARLEHRGLTEYPGVIPTTLETAYKIQKHSIKNWDDDIVGWKVGGIPAALQSQFQSERLAGPFFKKSLRYSDDGGHSKMPIFAEGFAAIEAEFVTELGDVSQLPNTGITHEQLSSAIARVFIGVEIASSPLEIINDIGPVGPVSDFGNNYGVIVGPEVKNWQAKDLSVYEVSVIINDEEIGRAHAPPAMKGPLGACKFLIEHLKAQGFDIPAGTLVSTGAITGVHRAYLGASSRIDFAGLGSMTLELTDSSKLQG